MAKSVERMGGLQPHAVSTKHNIIATQFDKNGAFPFPTLCEHKSFSGCPMHIVEIFAHRSRQLNDA